MKKIFSLALASIVLSLSVSSCGNENRKERARIEKEIQMCQDSSDFYFYKVNDKRGSYRPECFPSNRSPSHGVLSILHKKSPLTPQCDSLMSRAKIYRSRIDSLKRYLEVLPDK